MSTPLVGDERIAKHFDIHVEGYYDELEPERKAYEKRVRVLAAQWTRDIYEAELQSLRERLSRMEEAGNAMSAHPPASTEPRLTVEQAMEACAAVNVEWSLGGYKGTKKREWADEYKRMLRDRLTKAAKP